MTMTSARPEVQITPRLLPIAALVECEIPALVELRHDLHRHPEVMFEERRTARRIADELTSLGIEHRTGLAGGTGILGYLPAAGASIDSATTVALRADMDALPIEEKTGKPYASETPGVMHACGHDGHMSILVGAARVLSRMSERANNVLLLFQPAEEGGAGGLRMCEDGCLRGSVLGTPARAIYGLHGWPELQLGQVATRTGPLMAATDEFTLTIRGRGGHAAYPHMCIDPIFVSAQIVSALQSIVARRTNPIDSSVVTVGSIHAGHANNVIPDEAVLTGTIRALRAETRETNEREFRRIVSGVAESFGATAQIDWHPGYPVVVNDAWATERFRRVAREALGPDRVIERDHPTMGGEDFAFYGREAAACFFFLGLRPPGAARCPSLHTPEFDFADAALATGVEMMVRLALAPLQSPSDKPG